MLSFFLHIFFFSIQNITLRSYLNPVRKTHLFSGKCETFRIYDLSIQSVLDFGCRTSHSTSAPAKNWTVVSYAKNKSLLQLRLCAAEASIQGHKRVIVLMAVEHWRLLNLKHLFFPTPFFVYSVRARKRRHQQADCTAKKSMFMPYML